MKIIHIETHVHFSYLYLLLVIERDRVCYANVALYLTVLRIVIQDFFDKLVQSALIEIV